MLVYLFRDQNHSATLAYSTDVTGRNLTQEMPGTTWTFVKVTRTSQEEIPQPDKAMGHLRRHGFYVVEK
jgi:hypothetical protein